MKLNSLGMKSTPKGMKSGRYENTRKGMKCHMKMMFRV